MNAIFSAKVLLNPAGASLALIKMLRCLEKAMQHPKMNVFEKRKMRCSF